MRLRQRLTQEDFSIVSSRTYLSTLERGLRCPTIEKLDELAKRMEIHPLSLMVQAYLIQDPDINLDSLLNRIKQEVLVDSE